MLTRTSNRPNFFAETRWSVTQQSHRYVSHIVVTDDPQSLGQSTPPTRNQTDLTRFYVHCQ